MPNNKSAEMEGVTLLHCLSAPGVLDDGRRVCIYCGKELPFDEDAPCIGPLNLRKALIVYRECMKGDFGRLSLAERARVGFITTAVLGDHWNAAIIGELDLLYQKASQ